MPMAVRRVQMRWANGPGVLGLLGWQFVKAASLCDRITRQSVAWDVLTTDTWGIYSA